MRYTGQDFIFILQTLKFRHIVLYSAKTYSKYSAFKKEWRKELKSTGRYRIWHL